MRKRYASACMALLGFGTIAGCADLPEEAGSATEDYAQFELCASYAALIDELNAIANYPEAAPLSQHDQSWLYCESLDPERQQQEYNSAWDLANTLFHARLDATDWRPGTCNTYASVNAKAATIVRLLGGDDLDVPEEAHRGWCMNVPVEWIASEWIARDTRVDTLWVRLQQSVDEQPGNPADCDAAARAVSNIYEATNIAWGWPSPDPTQLNYKARPVLESCRAGWQMNGANVRYADFVREARTSLGSALGAIMNPYRSDEIAHELNLRCLHPPAYGEGQCYFLDDIM